MAYMTDSAAAAAAFQTATTNAKLAVTNLFNSYGFTRQNPDGTWSTAAGGAAFDPNKFVTLNPATGSVSVDTDAIRNLASGNMGVAFGYNALTDTIGGAAAREATSINELKARGITSGGLRQQARSTAEALQGRDLASKASEFVANLGNIYGDIGTAVTGAVTSNIESAGTGAVTGSEAVSVSAPAPTPTASSADIKPTGAGRMYERRGNYQYLGSKRGWVKVK